jgi:hypothetical protein
MRCARGDCRRRADVAVDFGEGLLVVLCYQDGVLALVERGGRTVRALRGGSPEVMNRPRGA